MRNENLIIQISTVALITLLITAPSSSRPTKREELERAAELAVERAAERVAERAVEKALETGNSTTETETIRASHSSVRTYDHSEQLPGPDVIQTPEERAEYLRVMKEREAAELAVQQIKHHLLRRRQVDDFFPEGAAESAEDFDDSPGFAGDGDIDIGPSFISSAESSQSEVPTFAKAGKLQFDQLGASFGPVSSTPSDYTSSRYVRQFPYHQGSFQQNPYQYGQIQYVSLKQEERAAPKEDKSESPKPKETSASVTPVIKPLIPSVKVYQVETKPVVYFVPPVNQYPVHVSYRAQPEVKILQQDSAEDDKRQRRGNSFF